MKRLIALALAALLLGAGAVMGVAAQTTFHRLGHFPRP